MPKSNKPGWVDWVKHPARKIILVDLEPGGALYGRNSMSAEAVFEWYKKKTSTSWAFEDVVFDQFEVRLKDHREVAKKFGDKAFQERQYAIHDRALNPRQTHDAKGMPVFDMSPAKMLLRKDLQLERNKDTTASKLWRSRTEYQEFETRVFCQRVRQERRRNKYINLCKAKGEKLPPNIPDFDCSDDEDYTSNKAKVEDSSEDENDMDVDTDDDSDLQ